MTEENPPYLIAAFNHNFPLKSHPVQEVEEYVADPHKRHEERNFRMQVADYKMHYTGTVNITSDSSHLSSLDGSSSSSSSSLTPIAANGQQGSSWLVAIRNRRTGKIKYRPATFVTFNPEIKVADADTTTILDKDAAREMRKKLTMQFGSKKKKRALEDKMANAVTNESLSNMINLAVNQVKDESSSMMNDTGLSMNGSQNPTTSAKHGTPVNRISSLLPPFNAEATSPSEIYDLNDIVSPDEVTLVTEAAAEFAGLSMEQKKEKGFNELVIELSFNLPTQFEARKVRSIYMLYLAYALNLFKLSVEENAFSQPAFENVIQNNNVLARLMLNKYAESQYFKNKGLRYRILAAGKDKLMAHVVVLLLALNGYTFEMSRVTKRVDVSDAKLTTICHVLGCTVKKSSSTGEKVVTLSSPPKEKPTATGSTAKRKK